MSHDPVPEFEGCRAVVRLRSGPIADLYQALQQPLGRPVLIKSLSSSILPSSPFAATLEREARLLATLDHPHILHLYDFVRTGERMWLVLEHVDGWNLDELMERGGHLSPSAAAALALDLARALEHAHARGVVHRDVQPRNVLVSREGIVKLVNFTVAVDERIPTAPELLDGGTSFGGPAYMSPEQLLGEPPDPRSDIFSLGSMLYEVLSGTRPFDGPDDRATTQRIRHDAPPPLARAVSGVPGSLERLLHRCLEKLPSDRFQSATELLSALKLVLKELGARSTRDAIVDDLVRFGLSTGGVSVSDDPPLSISPPRRFGFGKTLPGLIACGILVSGGGAAIQYVGRSGDEIATRGIGSKLELVPQSSGYLRVVADPWAKVIVDGQEIDTTPFARPIPLQIGTHYVRLEHPQAPPERRTVRLVAGETVLLDVKMAVLLPESTDGGKRGEGEDGGPDAAPPTP